MFKYFISIFERIVSALIASLSLSLVGVLVWFGYDILKEDAEDEAYMLGAKGFTFNPDTRWFGFALLAALVVSFAASKCLKVSFGIILGLLTTIIGIIFIIVPELVAYSQ